MLGKRLLKFGLITLAVIAMFTIAATPTLSAPEPVATVNVDYLNIYDTDGFYANIKTTVRLGDVVRLAGDCTPDAKWFHVIAPNGIWGWAYAPHLTTDFPTSAMKIWAQPPPPPDPLALTNVTYVNVHEAAGFFSPIKTQMRADAEVKLAGDCTEDTRWLHIIAPDGVWGYVYAPQLTTDFPTAHMQIWDDPTPKATVTAHYLNVRSGPGAGYAIKTYVEMDEVVQLSGIRDNAGIWVEVITFDGMWGWVNASYLNTPVDIQTFLLWEG
jgi:uncharacterized protein YraI